MKTTIDIPDPLLERTRSAAKAQGRTVKSLVEEALIELLGKHASKSPRVLRDASVPGALTPEYAGKTVTEMIHEDYAERENRIVHAADWMLDADNRG
jgi:hypothetical protein